VYKLNWSKNGRTILVSVLSSLISSVSMQGFQESLKFSPDKFKIELTNAYTSNNLHRADSIISFNRLLVKPYVDGVIRESIALELKGKSAESKKMKGIAEKTADSFEKIFGEKSLTIATKYLKEWSGEEKRRKLKADSLNTVAIQIRGNEPQNAILIYKNAQAIYKSIGDERGEADILGALGLIYFNSEDYKTALSYYKNALKARVQIDDKQLTGNSLNSLGAIYLNYLPDYEQALHFLDSAEIVRTEIGDQINLGRTIQAKASAYDKLNMVDHALQSFKKALEINQKAGDQPRVAEAYMNMGIILNSTGKYSEALDNLEKALKIYTDLEIKPSIREVLTQTGFVYTNLGDLKTAIEKLSEALKISKEADDKIGVAGAFNNLGIALQNAGRLEKANEYYDNALRTYQELGDKENVISALNNLGTVSFDQKDYSKAEEYLTRGLDLSRQIKDRDNESHCLVNLANDLLRLGRLEESMSNYNKALEIARALKSPELEWKSIAGMAENHESRGDLKKAVELNDTALTILEGMRNTLKTSEQKASFMANERFAYEDIIGMLASLHEKDHTKGYDRLAFQYAESSKGRVLLDLLVESAKDANKEKNDNSGIKPTNLRYQLPLSINEVQKICPDIYTVILEYSVGDSSSCLWVITGSDYHLFRLPGNKKLKDQVETLRFALQDIKQKPSEFFTGVALSLYEELIKPAEQYLTKKSRLVIIPDEILNYLPFEVLLTENNEKVKSESYAGLPFLVRKYPVSYGQSASVLKSLLSEHDNNVKSSKGDKKLIAFGDPVYEKPNSVLNPSGKNFSRLEYSGQEVDRIASFFKPGDSEKYLRENASEENIKKPGALKGFNYLHFATHGYIDEKNPDNSSLVLSEGENSSEDGFLRSSEIFKLNINADLVVLSACQTGLGKLIRGEGIVGLTRAFMYAGTPSVIVSLWRVNDASTATLMGEFYRGLIKNKLNKTDALRKAKLYLIKEAKFAHPFYWAPFVLIGDWM
jgi:CHAT domain-containing protein/Tfp pilus assembly protein PilF